MGGVFIVETPNANDALLTLYDCEEFKNFSYWSAHVQLYTSEALIEVLKKAGFSINWSRQIQRYSLSNHLYWLRHGKPGGHKKWFNIDSSIINEEYERRLEQLGCCDTLLISASPL